MVRLLETGDVLLHSFVMGELALGMWRDWSSVEALLMEFERLPLVRDEAVLRFIEAHELAGAGIGYIDAHLVAAAFAAGVFVWTRDRRLHRVAEKLRISFQE